MLRSCHLYDTHTFSPNFDSVQAAIAAEELSEKYLREEVADVLRQNASKLLEVGLSEQQVRKV